MDPQLTLNIICIVGTLIISLWIAFKHTPDLDNVQSKVLYRVAFTSFLWRTLIFLLETVSVMVRID